MGVNLREYPVRDESHIQRNANREVATVYQSRISRTPYPQLGGHAVTRAQNSSPVTT